MASPVLAIRDVVLEGVGMIRARAEARRGRGDAAGRPVVEQVIDESMKVAPHVPTAEPPPSRGQRDGGW